MLISDEYLVVGPEYRRRERQVRVWWVEVASGPCGRLGAKHGFPVKVRLTVTFSKDGAVVGTNLEADRNVSPSELQRFPWSRWLTVADATYRLKDNPGARAVWTAMGDEPDKKRPGAPALPDDFYASIANRYQELRAAGDTAPVDTMAGEHREHAPGRGTPAPRNTVAGWVRKCRERELLPPARGYRAG